MIFKFHSRNKNHAWLRCCIKGFVILFQLHLETNSNFYFPFPFFIKLFNSYFCKYFFDLSQNYENKTLPSNELIVIEMWLIVIERKCELKFRIIFKFEITRESKSTFKIGGARSLATTNLFVQFIRNIPVFLLASLIEKKISVSFLFFFCCAHRILCGSDCFTKLWFFVWKICHFGKPF